MLIEREKVSLPIIQQKMIKSAWGNNSIDETVLEKITYLSDGLKVKGYLAYPNDTSRKYPNIIWCRGGFGNAGALDDFNAQGILGQLSSWGYVVFESQYRGNVGGEGEDQFGGNDLNDVTNLISLADQLEFCNKNIWGIEGWSRGGMMMYLTLTRSNLFKAAISTGGISNVDCTINESSFMRKLIHFDQNKIDHNFCEKRSIVNFVDKYSKSTPTLLIHGTNDERVPPHHSLDLSYKFLENKIEHKLVLLENGDHFLREHKKEVDELRKKWFEKYLK
ncbi:MAG: S9 family peptidase [Ignavibacteriales bacterium]|nr:S9 family peptidase [Ignavibacteriales bacterium]